MSAESSGSELDIEYLELFTKHMQHARRIRSGKSKGTVTVRLGDINANLEPDGGATMNIMDRYQFKALSHRSNKINQLQTSSETVKMLQSDLQVKGEFKWPLETRIVGLTHDL